MGPFWKHLKSWSLQITAISARSLYCDMLHPTGTAASESCPTSSDDSDEGKQANHQHCACHAPAKLWQCTWGLMILHRALVWNNGCAITSTYNDTDKSSTHEYCHQRWRWRVATTFLWQDLFERASWNVYLEFTMLITFWGKSAIGAPTHTHKQTNKHTNEHTHTDKQPNTHTHTHTHTQSNKQNEIPSLLSH